LRNPIFRLSLGVVICLAAVLLLRNIAQVDFAAAFATASRISASQVLMILIMAAASYACLTGFDWLALRYVGHPLPYRQAALASFTALSLGHNIGLAALSSGAIRYRFYSRWGLSGVAIAKLIIFCAITVGLGLITLGGLVLLCAPEVSGRITGVGPAVAQILGGACLAVPAAYTFAAATRTKPLRFRRWTLDLPSLPLALGQVLLGALNFALVAACLHQALNAVSEASYPAVVSVYVLGNATAIASHVPGGLGVIEAAVVLLLPGVNSLAAALLFRLAYYLVPLPFGLAALATSELVYRRGARGAPTHIEPEASNGGEVARGKAAADQVAK
jgi:glycosyltransferase 2 family protein